MTEVQESIPLVHMSAPRAMHRALLAKMCHQWILPPAQHQQEPLISGAIKKEILFSANSSIVIQHSYGTAE